MEISILVVFVGLLLYWCRRHLGKGYSDDLRGSKRICIKIIDHELNI